MCNLFRKRKQQIRLGHFVDTVMNEMIHQSHEECAFCLDPLQNELCMITNKCNHFFHARCYEEYVQSCKKQNKKQIICPYCETVQ